jgi:hypothetical protein
VQIALATCSSLPGFEVDDLPLRRAFEARGAVVVEPCWDDASIEWERFDAVLIRTTWDYMDRCEEFVAWAMRVSKLTRLHNSAEVARWNTNKSYLRQFEEAGIPTIPTVWIQKGSTPDLLDLVCEQNWKRAFLKPTVGASASGTLRFDCDEEGVRSATNHLEGLLGEQSFMLQPYMQTVESQGELSAIFVDGKLTHGVRKVPVPGDYRVQDDYGATDGAYEFRDRELELASQVVAIACQHLGEDSLLYARVDFLFGEAGDLLLNELELVEPSLFFRHAPYAAKILADGLLARL